MRASQWWMVAGMWFAAAAVQAADMPKEMYGRYVQETGSCAEMQKAYKDTGMWDGVVVGKTGVGFIESSCDAARVSKAPGGAYNVGFKCSGEGEEWTFNAAYKLAGSVLTISTKDGAQRYKRCGK
jgi:hypothetical protein